LVTRTSIRTLLGQLALAPEQRGQRLRSGPRSWMTAASAEEVMSAVATASAATVRPSMRRRHRSGGRLVPMNRRPRLELHGSSASPEQAAAVISAIEQFLRDTAPAPTEVPERPSAWISAARLESVERAPAREPWAG
jgi:hypothetical protein